MMQKKQELTDWALNNIAFEREKSSAFNDQNRVRCRDVNMKENMNWNQAFKKFLENGVVDLIEDYHDRVIL